MTLNNSDYIKRKTMKKHFKSFVVLGTAALSLASQAALATCKDLTWDDLKAAADFVKNDATEKTITKGLGNNMWVTMVDETGMVCHVVNTAGEGQNSGQTWGLSRVISAQKANTSAMLSLDIPYQPWASGMVYAAAQPGGFLYGVQHSNPVEAKTAYAGSPSKYGTSSDPLRNKRIGGINVFGGGLPLYNDAGKKIGAIGASGDTSCTDHSFAWRVRKQLAANTALTINDTSADQKDIIDITGGFHAPCPLQPATTPLVTGIK